MQEENQNYLLNTLKWCVEHTEDQQKKEQAIGALISLCIKNVDTREEKKAVALPPIPSIPAKSRKMKYISITDYLTCLLRQKPEKQLVISFSKWIANNIPNREKYGKKKNNTWLFTKYTTNSWLLKWLDNSGIVHTVKQKLVPLDDYFFSHTFIEWVTGNDYAEDDDSLIKVVSIFVKALMSGSLSDKNKSLVRFPKDTQSSGSELEYEFNYEQVPWLFKCYFKLLKNGAFDHLNTGRHLPSFKPLD